MYLKPVKYQYKPQEDSFIYIEWFGSGWGIVKESSQFVFNKEGDWEYQPMPSSRDEAFYRRCRYATPEEAIACIEKFKLDVRMR